MDSEIYHPAKFHRPTSTHTRDIRYQKSCGQKSHKQTNNSKRYIPTCLGHVGIITSSKPTYVTEFKPTCKLRVVNPMKVADSGGCVNVDPKPADAQRAPSCRTKLGQLGLSDAVSDERQERIIVSLLTSWLSCRLCQQWAVGPETNVDVLITLTELPTCHLSRQQCNNTCAIRYAITCAQKWQVAT